MNRSRTLSLSFLLPASLLPVACDREEVFTGKREARGVWVSRFEYAGGNIANNPQRSQERIREVFQNARSARFNMVFFQVRGNGDAFYRSTREPWSQMLTGTLGQDPGWDPLQFALDEAHRLGLELHAWVNTFPIWRGKEPPTESTPRSVYLQHPDWLVCDKDGTPMPLSDHYVNISPGNPEARRHIQEVVYEIIEKYDVDGMHFDYIRYPEEATTRGYSHDAVSVARFNSPEGNPYKLSWEHWQREQINHFVFDVYNGIVERKPWVKVSAAVIGKYRGTGWTAYHAVYQDPGRWMELGKIDFIVPMVYWEREHPTHPFVPLITEWHDRVAYDRHVLPGLSAGLQRRFGWAELAAEVQEVRRKGLPGVVFFSAGGLEAVWKRLGVKEFPYWANVPSMPWKESAAPPPPQGVIAEKTDRGVLIRWQPPSTGERYLYNVYRSASHTIVPSDVTQLLTVTGRGATELIDSSPPARPVWYAVSALDRLGNESILSDVVQVTPILAKEPAP